MATAHGLHHRRHVFLRIEIPGAPPYLQFSNKGAHGPCIALFAWESHGSVFVGGAGVHVSGLVRVLNGWVTKSTYLRAVPPARHITTSRTASSFTAARSPPWRLFARDSEHVPLIRAPIFAARARAGEFDVVHAHDWLTAAVLSLIKYQRMRERWERTDAAGSRALPWDTIAKETVEAFKG